MSQFPFPQKLFVETEHKFQTQNSSQKKKQTPRFHGNGKVTQVKFPSGKQS
jgi:hypothetical protein